MNALEQYAANAAYAIIATPLPVMSQFLHMEDCVKARESQLATLIQEHAIDPAVKELRDDRDGWLNAVKSVDGAICALAEDGVIALKSTHAKTVFAMGDTIKQQADEITGLVNMLKEASTCLTRFAFNGGRLAESDWCKTQQLISSALVKYKDLP